MISARKAWRGEGRKDAQVAIDVGRAVPQAALAWRKEPSVELHVTVTDSFMICDEM